MYSIKKVFFIVRLVGVFRAGAGIYTGYIKKFNSFFSYVLGYSLLW